MWNFPLLYKVSTSCLYNTLERPSIIFFYACRIVINAKTPMSSSNNNQVKYSFSSDKIFGIYMVKEGRRCAVICLLIVYNIVGRYSHNNLVFQLYHIKYQADWQVPYYQISRRRYEWRTSANNEYHVLFCSYYANSYVRNLPFYELFDRVSEKWIDIDWRCITSQFLVIIFSYFENKYQISNTYC